jgi:hypothetical protein
MGHSEAPGLAEVLAAIAGFPMQWLLCPAPQGSRCRRLPSSFDVGIWGQLSAGTEFNITRFGLPQRRTYFPRRETPNSQERFHATQFRHGCISRTLHRTRRALQAKHAFFARIRGRSVLYVAIIAENIGCFRGG